MGIKGRLLWWSQWMGVISIILTDEEMQGQGYGSAL